VTIEPFILNRYHDVKTSSLEGQAPDREPAWNKAGTGKMGVAVIGIGVAYADDDATDPGTKAASAEPLADRPSQPIAGAGSVAPWVGAAPPDRVLGP